MPIRRSIVNSKWLIVLATALLIYSQSNINSLNAQTPTPFQKSQADYTFQLTKYAEAKDKYTTARANYLAFKTAASKNEAFAKTKEYLLQVHSLYLSYFSLVEERTNLFDWSKTSYSKEDIHKQIDDETKLLEESKQNVEKTTTLEELPPIASSLKTHLQQVTINKMFKLLASADVAQIEDSTASFAETAQKVDEFAVPRVKDENRQLYNNWKSETENIKSDLATQIKLAKDSIATARINNTSDITQFDFDTEKPQQLLLRAKNLIGEILNFL